MTAWRGPRRPRRAGLWVAGALLGVTLLALALSRSATTWDHLLPTRGPAQVAPGPAPAPPLPEGPAPASRVPAPRGAPLVLSFDPRPLNAAAVVVGVLGVLLLGLGAAALWCTRARARESRRVTLPEVLMAAGLLFTALVCVVAALVLSYGGAGVQAADLITPGGPVDTLFRSLRLPPVRELDVTAALSGGVWGLLLLFAALVVGAAGLALARRDAPGTPPAPVPAAPPAPTDAPPTHRVRQAHRAADAALLGAGYGRPDTESPATYAARLGAQCPPLAVPLSRLTRLYEPVRYGGRVTEADAEDAEAALRDVDVQALLPTLTAVLAPPDPDPLPPSPSAGAPDRPAPTPRGTP